MPYYRAPNGKLIFSETPLELSQVDPGFAQRYVPGHGMQSPSLRQAEMLSRLPDADIVGFQGPGVVPGGEQAGGARRMQREVSDVLPPAPTYRPLAGAKQNYRGGSKALIIGGPNGTPEQRVNTLVQSPKNAGDDAEMIAISLGLNYIQDLPETVGVGDTDLGVNTFLKATATLQWGIGGAIFEAEIDWNQGTQIALPASFMNVGLRVGASSGFLNPNPLEVVFSAALAYGTPISNRRASPVRRTITVATPDNALAAGATSSYFTIPRWANSFTILSGQAPSLRVELLQNLTAGSQVTYTITDQSNQASQTEDQFPIPNGYRFFRLVNTGLLDANYLEAVFNLAL